MLMSCHCQLQPSGAVAPERGECVLMASLRAVDQERTPAVTVYGDDAVALPDVHEAHDDVRHDAAAGSLRKSSKSR